MDRRTERRQTKKKPEFSKIILALCMCVYIVTVGFGFFVTATEKTQLGELLAFVGAPTAVAIGFYAWKARAENLLKIKKENPDMDLSEIRKEDENGYTDDNSLDNWSDNTDSDYSLPDNQSKEQSKRVASIRRVRGRKAPRG